MSTWAVFGMARHRAVEEARLKVPKAEQDGKQQIPLDHLEWERRVQAYADKVMAGKRTIQLSTHFDAPQFAVQFRDIAKRDGAARLAIRAFVETSEKNPKTGKFIKRWLPCREDGSVIERRS